MTQQGTLADGLDLSHSRAVWLGRLLKAGIGTDVIALVLGLEQLSLLRRLQGGEDISPEVRSGPGTVRLGPDSAEEYVRTRWG